MTRKQRKDREYRQRIKHEFIRNLRKLRECIRKRCRLLKATGKKCTYCGGDFANANQ